MSKRKIKRNNKQRKDRKDNSEISFCLIVRDEEQFLPTCLESIKKLANEIIVVDTGSSDRTVAIAEGYGARVYHHPWKSNFSLHRNQSIGYAQGDWIFVIDADEVLNQEDIPLIRKAIRDKDTDTILVHIHSRLRNGRSSGTHCLERIFRNNGAIHYEGRVHNRLVGFKQAKVYPIRLEHYGYDLEPEAARKKFERTVALLNLDLAEDPQNPMTFHYLGCSYLTQGMFPESLAASRKAIALAEERQDENLIYIWSHYNAAMSCYMLRDREAAVSLSLSALKRFPRHMDSHFVLVLAYFDQDQWERVIYHGEEYLRLARLHGQDPGSFQNLVICTLKERWNLCALMAMAQEQLGHKEQAEDLFKKAQEWAPDPFLVVRAAGIFYHKQGALDRAQRYLKAAEKISPEDETVGNLLAEINAKVEEKLETISCCLIVKNEEAFLDQCLASVKDFVDEIIVVDTGSTDGTVEIAKRYTERVYFHPWEGSFSKARNHVLSYAKGDWIFQIDGDEELLPGSGEKLREEVNQAGAADIILVNIISPYSNGTKRARHNFERLFRNNGVIHYEGIVHNRVVGGRNIKAANIELLHYGYDLDEKKSYEKYLRTSALLKKQISENPEDPMPHHYLGVSYLSRGLNEDAARESLLAIELADRRKDGHPIYLWARHNAAIAFFRQGNLDRALELSQAALRNSADHLDSLYVLTMVAAERGLWDEVLSWGRTFLALRDRFEKKPEEAGIMINTTLNEGPSILLLIGHAWHRAGALTKMAEAYQTAADLADEKWQVWWNAGCFHLDRSGDLERAGAYLEMARELSPERPEAYYMLAKLNNKKGLYPQEKRALEELFRLGSRDTLVLDRLSVLCIEYGEENQAVDALEELVRLEPNHYAALCRLGKIRRNRKQFNQALEVLTRALRLEAQGIDPLYGLGEISLQLGSLDEARTFFESVLSLREWDIKALLFLCEIDLRQDRLLDFIGRCDRLLKELSLERNLVVNTLQDVFSILLDINYAVKDQPDHLSQVRRLLRLLSMTSDSLQLTAEVQFQEGESTDKLDYFQREVQRLKTC